MNILSIDTTTDWGSLALLEDERTIEEMLLHSGDGFAHVLFGHIDALLKRNGWAITDIDMFTSATGPGSFTGLRVGLSAAKGLAETLGKPLVGVSNLKAIASFGTLQRRAAFMDARRGEIFGAVYDATGAAVMPEAVMRFADWLASIATGSDVEFITPQAGVFASAFRGTQWEEAPLTESPKALAAAIGRIGLSQQLLPDCAGVDANYVRRSDAEMFWRE